MCGVRVGYSLPKQSLELLQTSQAELAGLQEEEAQLLQEQGGLREQLVDLDRQEAAFWQSLADYQQQLWPPADSEGVLERVSEPGCLVCSGRGLNATYPANFETFTGVF